MITKRCSKCGEVKPNEAFSVDKSGRHGTRPDCKQCVSLREAKRNQLPHVKAKTAARMRRYRRLKPDKFVAASRRYYAKYRDDLIVKARAWRAANPEIAAALNRNKYAHRKTLKSINAALEPLL